MSEYGCGEEPFCGCAMKPAPTSPVPTERSDNSGAGFTVNDRGVFDGSGAMVKGYAKKYPAPKDSGEGSGENRAIAEKIVRKFQFCGSEFEPVAEFTAALDAIAREKDAEILRYKKGESIESNERWLQVKIANDLRAKIAQLESDKKALEEALEKIAERTAWKDYPEGDNFTITRFMCSQIAVEALTRLTPERSAPEKGEDTKETL